MHVTQPYILRLSEAYPGAEEIYMTYLLFVQNGPESGLRDEKMTWDVYPEATTWEQFVTEKADVLFP